MQSRWSLQPKRGVCNAAQAQWCVVYLLPTWRMRNVQPQQVSLEPGRGKQSQSQSLLASQSVLPRPATVYAMLHLAHLHQQRLPARTHTHTHTAICRPLRVPASNSAHALHVRAPNVGQEGNSEATLPLVAFIQHLLRGCSGS